MVKRSGMVHKAAILLIKDWIKVNSFVTSVLAVTENSTEKHGKVSVKLGSCILGSLGGSKY